jgi:DNA-binding NtrC family response regulator
VGNVADIFVRLRHRLAHRGIVPTVAGMVRQFIIIDDNRDGRFVLSRALFRDYRTATLHEFRDLMAARELLAKLPPDGGQTVVLLHRTAQLAGAELIRSVRALHPGVILVALGAPASARTAIEAGATCFLEYEAWLRLGPMIKELEASQLT